MERCVTFEQSHGLHGDTVAHGNKCGLCGREPAYGLATINDQRYCHGDYAYPTCYMIASWEASGAARMFMPEVVESIRTAATSPPLPPQ